MRRVVFWVAGIAVAGVAAAAGIAYWQASSIVAQFHAGPKAAVVKAVAHELHRKPRRSLVQIPPEPSAQTILLIGSDRRWAGGDGARSDTMILARIDPPERRIALLSIPRDLYVPIPGHGHDRINMAFRYGGERLLTHVVRDTFGVEIDHFVEVDFHGFKDLIHDLGGIYVPVDQRYFNRNVGTAETNYANIDLRAGYQRLDAQQALAFARFRHSDNDFVRAARQQLVLRIVAHDALAGGWNPFRARRLALALAKATTSDISSLGEVYALAHAVYETPSSRIDRTTVQAGTLLLDGADYLASTPTQLRSSIRSWLTLGSHRHRQRRRAAPLAARTQHHDVPLVPDDGQGRRILAGADSGMRTCAPTALPGGFFWPAGAARSYPLDGHPALAAYATAGSGNSILWMYTTWRDPPILGNPSGTVTRGRRTYELYTEHGKLRQIAWHIGPTTAWITNSLQDTLTNAEMLALATTCR